MHLVNFPPVRVKKYPMGYAVEKMHTNLVTGRKYWKHIISVSGMPNEPWYYSTYEMAVSEAAKFFTWDLHHGTARNP